jgi:hypothetical protein
MWFFRLGDRFPFCCFHKLSAIAAGVMATGHDTGYKAIAAERSGAS